MRDCEGDRRCSTPERRTRSASIAGAGLDPYAIRERSRRLLTPDSLRPLRFPLRQGAQEASSPTLHGVCFRIELDRTSSRGTYGRLNLAACNVPPERRCLRASLALGSRPPMRRRHARPISRGILQSRGARVHLRPQPSVAPRPATNQARSASEARWRTHPDPQRHPVESGGLQTRARAETSTAAPRVRFCPQETARLPENEARPSVVRRGLREGSQTPTAATLAHLECVLHGLCGAS